MNASTGSAQVSVEVEAHFRPLFLDSPLRNWRLQRWFMENEQFQTLSSSPCLGRGLSLNGSNSSSGSNIPLSRGNEGVFPIPTVSFNAVYQLLHIYKHLFEEGIGLRQLLDYYFVLRALHIEQGELADRTESMAQWAVLRQAQEPEKDTVGERSRIQGIAVKSNAEIMHTLSRFGMKKFAGAVMYVIAKVFANDDDNDTLRYDNWASHWPWMICEPNEKEGKFLLNEIMQAGNFGKYDDRIKRPSKSPLDSTGSPQVSGDFLSPQMRHAWEKTKHNFRLLAHYPEEVLWEPVFRVYHWIWRKLELWR